MNNTISRIAPIASITTPEIAANKSPVVGEDWGMFDTIFRSAIENVKQTDAAKTETEYLLATGQLDNPAVMGIASTKAQIAVDLLVQLRNKALDAYSELTRISL